MVEREQNKSKSGSNKTTTIDDFDFIKQVGQGSFGSVYLAQDKETEEYVAIKILSKLDIIKKQKEKAVMREKDLLKKLNGNAFIVNLKQTFMDADSLYFVFEKFHVVFI